MICEVLLKKKVLEHDSSFSTPSQTFAEKTCLCQVYLDLFVRDTVLEVKEKLTTRFVFCLFSV